MPKKRFTKVYTKTGDKGQTGLAGGRRVPKDDLRVECYGTVDELNSCIGVVRSFARSVPPACELSRQIEPILERIQNELFVVGLDLATPVEGRRKALKTVGAETLRYWERAMDQWNTEIPALEDFLLPGGNRVSALLHLARTVCRRAERLCVKLARETSLNPFVVSYLNRLSDTLFVLARWVAVGHGETESIWKRP